MCSAACLEELLKTTRAFDITIFGDEPHPNYDRTLLAGVLAGERDPDSLVLNDFEWYQEQCIRTRLGIRVEEIDRKNRGVRSSDGDWTHYDKLVLATGASPEIPSIGGLDLARVHVFATLDDARRLAEAAAPGVRAVVIGGWLAADAARALEKRGCEVKSVDVQELPRLAWSEGFTPDLIVIATNLLPNAMLARDCGLRVNRGIVVNDQMETSDPHIFAIGACTEHNGRVFDCLPPMLEQAKVLAANLAGAPGRGFRDLDSVFQELTASPLHQRAE